MASKEEKNKSLVLEAFDTLFNKRDYEAARRYWFTELHPAQHIEPGREGLFNLIKTSPASLKYEPAVIVEGDFRDHPRSLPPAPDCRETDSRRHRAHRERGVGRALGRAPRAKPLP